MTDVSIIIPTFNSEATIEECLKSIRQNYTCHKYEIIVCDAGSMDKTLEIARHYADKVLMGNHHKINRNIGIENAEGEVILFTDSDCLVPEKWIDYLVAGLNVYHKYNYKIIGVGGGNMPWAVNPSPIEQAIILAMRSPFISFKARNTASYSKDCEVTHNPPINSAYYAWVLNQAGGFIENDHYGEDVDLDARLIELNYKLMYLTDIEVKHRHKDSYGAFARQMYDFGIKRIKVNRQHPCIARFYHYGPAVLALMIYSPFIFIPLAMALLNSLIMRNIKVFRLTLSFYRNYGAGEIKAWRYE